MEDPLCVKVAMMIISIKYEFRFSGVHESIYNEDSGHVTSET